MQTAGARAPRADDDDMSREEVLSAWERKIEAAERGSGRFARPPSAEDGTRPRARRFERRAAVPEAQPAPERRTITITGRPDPVRRRRSVVEAQLAQPDRIALWAFLLGLFLVAVAAGTAHP